MHSLCLHSPLQPLVLRLAAAPVNPVINGTSTPIDLRAHLAADETGQSALGNGGWPSPVPIIVSGVRISKVQVMSDQQAELNLSLSPSYERYGELTCKEVYYWSRVLRALSLAEIGGDEDDTYRYWLHNVRDVGLGTSGRARAPARDTSVPILPISVLEDQRASRSQSKAIRDAMAKRYCFATVHGLLGIGPRQTWERDLIVMFDGCAAAYAIRKRPEYSGVYHLNGQVFVDVPPNPLPLS